MNNKLRWCVPLLVISLVILNPQKNFANDAPIHLIGGGATPRFRSSQTIRMEAEEVIIRLGQKTYRVDATFHFFNTGKTEERLVGFPKRGMGYWGEFKGTKPFIRFETWVNDVKTDFVEEPGSASISGHKYLPDLIATIKDNKDDSFFLKDDRWLVKHVKFDGQKRTTTRVLYEAEYQELYGGGCLAAYYIYGTGAYWKEAIGNAKFIVDDSDKPQDKSVLISFPAGSEKRYQAKKRQLSPTMTEYQVLNFEPDVEDQLFIFIGVCP